VGQDTAASLVAFARAEKATQLVIGATRRSRVYDWLHGSFVTRVTRLASDLDVHVFGRSTTPDDTPTRPSSRRSGSPHLGRRRTIAAWLIALIGLPALTGIVRLLDSAIELSTTLLLFLAVVLLVAAIGGRLVAAISAVAASVLVNWFFVEPRYTFTISRPEQVVALGVFVAVALTVGVLVDQSARRAAEARRARLEAAALARSAASLAADPEPLPALVEQICRTFDLDGARITTEGIDGVVDTRGSWGTIDAPTSTVIDLRSDDTGRSRRLEISGRRLSADDRRVVGLLADQLAVALDTEFLAREAAAAVALSEIDGVRTALLRAVSHDLRTPISTIKALVTGLLDDSVQWTPDQLHDALADVDHETDRLDRLVGNLLDASRLQIGALAVHRRPTSLADVVEAALESLGPEGLPVEVSVSDDLPAVDVDPALLERCIANVVSNAVRHAASTGPVLVTGEMIDAVLHLRVVDRGPGIPVAERDHVLAPFQRLGDRDTSTGVGLGLAITKGFVEAMHGAVLLDDTAGGGLTVTLILPTVPAELAP
jgi:two-component system sensor histidine kinase KdpD